VHVFGIMRAHTNICSINCGNNATKIIPSTICDRLAEPLAKSDDAIDNILVSYIYTQTMYNKCPDIKVSVLCLQTLSARGDDRKVLDL